MSQDGLADNLLTNLAPCSMGNSLSDNRNEYFGTLVNFCRLFRDRCSSYETIFQTFTLGTNALRFHRKLPKNTMEEDTVLMAACSRSLLAEDRHRMKLFLSHSANSILHWDDR